MGRAATAAPADALYERVRAGVGAVPLLSARARLVVAVSGGADSVCLLDVVVRLRRGSTAGLRVVHVDHRFRPDSGEDGRFVQRLAEARGVSCEVVVVDGPAFAAAERIGVEQAGRVLRYRALAAVGARMRARAVATGHTGDDSVESVLMHFVRGAGPEGLRGIAGDETLRLGQRDERGVDAPDSVRVLRPLLALRRSETAAYCVERGLPWREDPTNLDPSFLRNRVRHHLLPILRTYNPSVDAAIARTAIVAREEDGWIDGAASRCFRRLAAPVAGGVGVSLGAWRRQPRVMQRRLLRMAVAEVGGNRDRFGFETVERALAFAAADGPRRLDLPDRLTMTRSGDRLCLTRTTRA